MYAINKTGLFKIIRNSITLHFCRIDDLLWKSMEIAFVQLRTEQAIKKKRRKTICSIDERPLVEVTFSATDVLRPVAVANGRIVTKT